MYAIFHNKEIFFERQADKHKLTLLSIQVICLRSVFSARLYIPSGQGLVVSCGIVSVPSTVPTHQVSTEKMPSN